MIQLTDKVLLEDGHSNINGFWHTKARFARAGVQVYPKRELAGLPGVEVLSEPIKVLRPDSVVFDSNAMASFEHVPVTMEHEGGAVTTDNARGSVRGASKAPVSQDAMGRMTVPVVLYDGELIKDIKSGERKELSAGYTADFDVVPGVDPKYGEYDVVMTSMVGNHITVTRSGKAGPEFTIGDKKMAENYETRKYQGVSILFDSQGAEAFDAVVADAKADKDAVTDLSKKVDELQAKLDLADSNKISDADLDKLVTERADAVDQVRKVHDGIETAGKSVADMKREAVAATCDLDITDKSDDYVAALFDAKLAEPETNQKPKQKTKKVEDKVSVADEARARFIKERSGR